MALKVGVTGGIGSGKTTVCKIFNTLGVPIYYADDRAKQLMVENNQLIAEIKEVFGKEAYFGDGQLNRKYISAVAFQDSSKLKALNSIVHPAVRQDAIDWQEKYKNQPYTIKEAALLFEAGSYKDLDKIITVTAPKEMRIERVMKRDLSTREEVIARIEKQWDDKVKVSMSDFVILNDYRSGLIQQIIAIHKQLKG